MSTEILKYAAAFLTIAFAFLVIAVARDVWRGR